MRDLETLKRLREIRRFRERQAEERVVQAAGQLAEAEQTVAEARDLVETEIERAVTEERAAFAAVQGQAVRGDRLLHLQHRVAVQADVIDRAKHDQAEAEVKRDDRRGNLASTRAVLGQRVRSVVKLDNALKGLKARRAGRDIARAEQALDDDRNSHAPQGTRR